MSFICYLCSNIFTQKYNLNRHFNENRCKTSMIDNLMVLNNYIKNLHEQNNIKIEKDIIKNNTNNININNININNTIIVKLEININPITKLNTTYLDFNKMLQLLENFDKDKGNKDNLNLVLVDYIKDIICNTDHPENHSIKYIKKNPPTYNTVITDSDGNIMNVIKNLKNTCELLSDPVLNILKNKLNSFTKKYNKDDNEWNMIEDSVVILKEELQKENVKKALKNVLRDDILNNVEMKLCKNNII